MKTCNRSEVEELLKKTALRMGMKEPGNELCGAVWQHCAKHGLETIRSAMINFEKQEIKYFPKLGEINSKVKSISKRDEHFSPADGICRYNDFSECEVSKKVCRKKVDGDDARVSMWNYGKVYCRWHQDREYAKNFPDSAQAKIHAVTLSYFAKLTEYNPDLQKSSQREDEMPHNMEVTGPTASLCVKSIPM